jgi:menaquinone-dependent protoporphyrinogen oxidase
VTDGRAGPTLTSMTRFLVAFASSEGQTEKIAHHVARRLEDLGHLTRLVDLNAGESEAGADECDAAVLAGSLHLSQHPPELANFIDRHRAALQRLPCLFLSVSLSAASHDKGEIAALKTVIRDFLGRLALQPTRVELVAGAVHDRELNAIERLVLHRIVDAHGVERHPSGNTELTDWPRLDEAVAAFAQAVTSG